MSVVSDGYGISLWLEPVCTCSKPRRWLCGVSPRGYRRVVRGVRQLCSGVIHPCPRPFCFLFFSLSLPLLVGKHSSVGDKRPAVSTVTWLSVSRARHRRCVHLFPCVGSVPLRCVTYSQVCGGVICTSLSVVAQLSVIIAYSYASASISVCTCTLCTHVLIRFPPWGGMGGVHSRLFITGSDIYVKAGLR